MCDPEDSVCSNVKRKLHTLGIGPDSSPADYPDMVLAIAQCAAKPSGYTTFYPYRSMGWGGFKEFRVKDILIRNGWTFVDRKYYGRARFLRPS